MPIYICASSWHQKMFAAALQISSRFLHIVSAATLCGGMQILTAPEALVVNGTKDTWPLYNGSWVWDKSIALALLVEYFGYKLTIR